MVKRNKDGSFSMFDLYKEHIEALMSATEAIKELSAILQEN